MAEQPNRRQTVYLERQYQAALVRMICWHWTMFAGATLALLGGLHLLLAEDPWRAPWATLWEGVRQNLLVVVVIAALLPKLVRDSLRLSHRVVGPVLKLNQSIERRLAGEDEPPLRLRANDFFQELAANYNRLTAEGDSRAASRARTVEQAQELVGAGRESS